ncbi:MAG: glucosaminidase domain-containing protein [Hyphomicrobiaceae bacterium]
MKRRISLGVAAGLMLFPAASFASGAPPIKVSASNKVPACVTPGRLTAFLKARNDRLDPRFEKIAVEYMRRGEELGLRWDYTFYQMVLETGYLTYRGDRGRRGDVSPSQNNFAGLGATGRGNPGESFADMKTGVLAHLQHVLLYAGETVENPVAERTRKVQEWGILASMKKRAHGRVTFAHLAKKWAPGSDYVAGLQGVERKFQEDFCNGPDPHPEWVAEARGVAPVTTVAAVSERAPDKITGDELARRAIEDGKAEGNTRMSGLGAPGMAKAATPSYSLLNAPSDTAQAAPQATEPAVLAPSANAQKPANGKRSRFMTASAAGSLAKAEIPKVAPPHKQGCRVWTASYGGLKALIIRVRSDKGTDYTVLDVNEGAEKREADAYIAAYAKGGEIAGEFATQTQALDKAFELCPEK